MADPIQVVTCFLRHAGEILLVQRSEDASVLPGRWSALSGTIEGHDPLKDALRAIAEHTGTTGNMRLVRAGAALTVEHEGTTWLVHPYLFEADTRQVSGSAGSERFEWVPAPGILVKSTVPGLWEAYRRVAPSLEDVHFDHIHGSSALAEEALEVLRDAAAEAARVNDPRGWVVLESLAHRLVRARPAMTAVEHRLGAALDRARAEGTAAAIEREAHTGIAMGRQAEREAALLAAAEISGKRVLTLSRSETILEALTLADPPPLRVVVAVSEPGGEGHDVADHCKDIHIPTARIPDASVAWVLMSGDVDLVLVGADSILAGGDVINKTGTLGAALVAMQAGVPFLCTASTDKVRRDTTADLEPLPPAAVFPARRDGSPIEANRFDRTPERLITAYLTERGRLQAQDL